MVGRRILPLLLLVLHVTACGGDDAAPERAERPASTTTAAPAGPTDEEVAEAALLRLSDFPPDWRDEPADGDDDDDTESQRRIAQCVGVDFERLYGDDVEAESPTFVSPDDAEVSNTADVEPSEDEARFAFESLTSDRAVSCVAEELQRTVAAEAPAQDLTVGQVSIRRISFPELGDQSAAFRVNLPVEAQGQSVEIYVDVAVVRVGRGGVTVQALQLFEPFATEQLADHTEAVTERLRRALAGA